MHNDEPIIEGEANMDDSSDSGSDGEETEEDKRNYANSLARADAHIQTHSKSREHHHHHKLGSSE